jgi:hypothetical protein
MKSLAVLLLLALSAPTLPAADYGVRTRFQKDEPLTFPDCELIFRGTRTVKSPLYPRGMLFYDFEVRAGDRTKKISWSEGTGDIGPEFFEMNGRRFVLELGFSAAFRGRLKEDELVLWREADFPKGTNR